jgi:hypothetical protein
MQFFGALPALSQIALRAGFRNWNSTLLTFHAGAECLVSGVS